MILAGKRANWPIVGDPLTRRPNTEWPILVLTVVWLSCLIPSALSLYESGNTSPGDKDKGTTYGVIVDCGSSGTRANLYSWNNALIYPALLLAIEPLRNETDQSALSIKKTPGLSTMKDEPEKSSDYMKKILNFITDNIPKESYSSTGVYFMATAGMRLLDKEIQQQIMDDIAKDVDKKYNFAKIRTNVISGAQEGMYQWISVNSKAKRFLPAMETGKKLFGEKTYALIEMGGASIQVAYQLRPDLGSEILSKLPKNTGIKPAFMGQIVEPSISRETEGHKYELHSTTFLGLGSNSARDNYLDMLIKKPDNRFSEQLGRYISTKLFKRDKSESRKQPVVIKDPCMPVGSSEDKKKPTRMLSKKETKILGFLEEEEGEEMFTVKVVGTGNYAACRKKVSKFLRLCKKEKLYCEPDEPCTMDLLGTPFVPFDAYEFLGLGEFYYTTSSMMKLGGIYNHNAIIEKTKEMCETKIHELESKYPDANKFDKDRSRSECFKAVFADTFLTEGLLMPHDYSNLETVGNIGKESVDWTLGAVLDKSLTIEMAADKNAEDDDDDDDESYYEDYEDMEEAEEDEHEEDQAETNQEATDKHLSDGDLEEDSSSMDDQAQDTEEEPRYRNEQSDEEATFEMAENLADAESDTDEKLIVASQAPGEITDHDQETSLAENIHEPDYELAELEQAESYRMMDRDISHIAGGRAWFEDGQDVLDKDVSYLEGDEHA